MAEDALSETVPWFRSPPTATQWSVVETLTGIWVRDPEVAVAAARMPMLTDPGRPLHPTFFGPSIISRHDRDAVVTLAAIGEADRETALALTGSAWFGDGIEYDESGGSGEGAALQHLLEMTQLSPELTRAVLGLDWVTDGFPAGFSDETAALRDLVSLAELDVDVAAQAAVSPVIAYSIGRGLGPQTAPLVTLTGWSPELARQILAYVSEEPVRDRDSYMIRALGVLASDREKFERIIGQPWFADGLDAAERAFITALRSAEVHDLLFNDMMDSYFTRGTTITLPLAGEVSLWAFHHDPFPSRR